VESLDVKLPGHTSDFRAEFGQSQHPDVSFVQSFSGSGAPSRGIGLWEATQ
jgi:hypothetical protein